MDIIFTINPYSGYGALKGKKKVLEELKSVCSARGISHSFLVDEQLNFFSKDTVLVICGGDGAIFRMINYILKLDSPPPFAIIPMGTGNDIARATGWYEIWKRGGASGFIDALIASRCNDFDVWELSRSGGNEKWCFSAYLGIGLDAKGVKYYEALLSFWGKMVKFPFMKRLYYILAGIRVLISEGSPFKRGAGNIKGAVTIKESDAYFECPSKGVLLFSNIGNYMGGAWLYDGTRFDDGLLDIFLWPTPKDFLKFVIRGTTPAIFKKDVKKAFFSIPKGLYGQADGEFLGELPSGDYCIALSRVLPILIPPKMVLALQPSETKLFLTSPANSTIA